MAAEYLANAVQQVSLNGPVIFTASIPCRKGYVIHRDESGVFILRGVTNQCYATYQLTFSGNIAIPEGGTVGPIALAITLEGEPLPTSRAIYTPAAVDQYGNVTCTAIIQVRNGCCLSTAVRSVSASNDPTVTPTSVINVQNGNLVIDRIA
jgi:hypothetical protein